MKNILHKEFQDFKKKNPNTDDLDMKEYLPVEVKFEEKNKNLKSVDSISMNYDLSRFQIIEGKYKN